MDFHGQSAVETTHVAYLEEVPLTHEEARGGRCSLGALC